MIGLLKRLRDVTDLPIAVGFGVSGPEDIEFLKPYADYAIVGSQGLRVLQQSGLDGLRQFWVGLKKPPDPQFCRRVSFDDSPLRGNRYIMRGD
ncbi:MAG: tryptophan synthase subunit alpha [Coxiellaceae bacterium]|nr:MAG: tryptophan synthase subunit alpha [Coxiellaceae bacterium]